MTVVRKLGFAALFVLASGALRAQSPAPAPAFEVTSVKPLEPGATRYAIGPAVNGTVRYRSAEVRRLVAYAFGIGSRAHPISSDQCSIAPR
jgi:hypothetical protein